MWSTVFVTCQLTEYDVARWHTEMDCGWQDVHFCAARDYAGVYTCIASYGDGGNQSSIVINVTYFGQSLLIDPWSGFWHSTLPIFILPNVTLMGSVPVDRQLLLHNLRWAS